MKKRKKSSILSKSRVSGESNTQQAASGVRPKRSRPRPSRSHVQEKGKERKVCASSEILRQAAYAVGRLVEADETGKRGVSLKSLTLGSQVKQKRAVYAVTVETLKYYRVLESIGRSVGLVSGKNGMSLATCCVLIKEIILGSGLSRVGPAEKMILAYEKDLKNALKALLEERGVQEPTGLLPDNALALAAKERRRTVRVNTLKSSIEDVKKILLCDFGKVYENAYIPEVLELDPGTDLHSHRLVQNGSIILQSLASCIPAFVLDPKSSWNIIDACAAPGNKTTHVAAIMSQKQAHEGVGHVIAFDKDPKRLQRLKDNASLTGAITIIDAHCDDFLKTDPNEFKHIDAILLDPSCSGSGTSVSRMDYLLPSSQDCLDKGAMFTDKRVKQLSEFQISAIQHAMTFPNVKRIVYSTCSIYHEENEGVVAHLLSYAQEHGFKLKKCFDRWPRRGMSVEGGLKPTDASKVVRIDPLEDGTDGFFVAMFDR